MSHPIENTPFCSPEGQTMIDMECAADEKHEEPPPSYSSMFPRTITKDSPPTYCSLSGNRGRPAVKQPHVINDDQAVKLPKKRKPIGVIVAVVLMSVFCLCMIIIGAVYHGDCGTSLLPVYLIVNGVVSLLFMPCYMAHRLIPVDVDDEEEYPGPFSVYVCLLGTFLVGWSITGSVFLFQKSDVANNSNKSPCTTVVYYFSTWVIVTYIMVLIWYIAVGALLAMRQCFKRICSNGN